MALRSIPHNSSKPLHFFAIFAAFCTFLLIGLGGLVTSKGVGMAVPDWPTTYGYNMFFFHWSQWEGGIFYEHSHRLFASWVGFLTMVLCVWTFGRRARKFLRWSGLAVGILAVIGIFAAPGRWQTLSITAGTGFAALIASFFWPRTEPTSKPVRVAAIVALVAVIFQGVLGGLRVVAYKDEIGIFHATLAQMFLVLLTIIAFVTYPNFSGLLQKLRKVHVPCEARWLCLATTGLIFVQLTIAATMRHEHAGLAVPDFPLAYGKIWPPTDEAFIAEVNATRHDHREYNDITKVHILVHMAHRIVAVLIAGCVFAFAWILHRQSRGSPFVVAGWAWAGIIAVQILLGGWTVWSNKAADIATLHVMIGALTLVLASLCSFSLLCFRPQEIQQSAANRFPTEARACKVS